MTGFASAMLLALAGLVGLGFLLTGPQLDVQVSLPDSALRNEAFAVTIEIANPHAETVELDNLDIPDRVFDRFEVLDVDPAASPESPVGGLGSQTWFYDLPVEPGGRQTVELTVRGTRSGAAVFEIDVCNEREDCTSVARPVLVE